MHAVCYGLIPDVASELFLNTLCASEAQSSLAAVAKLDSRLKQTKLFGVERITRDIKHKTDFTGISGSIDITTNCLTDFRCCS